ncbi:hypothetical protein PCANC_16749 [Puccinia coronata f. sp. avenae]|uniref:DUF427 domain-containing protein n=1 Tax=Puccinia coronata f. sp. avenae TaxID=200324 RepID=A0A2N5S367_9BASI|nr:hypothetical protein PCASD_22813 [Puccinia coronata f. sp. avenae]PLW13856.1 hypothetical protein PCANC_16749 [Puccinia coronata f. sp. avenae]
MSEGSPKKTRAVESVWEYPRPPLLVPCSAHVRVIYHSPEQKGEDVVVADTHKAIRVLETSHPPTYYIPSEDVKKELLRESSTKKPTMCEWKGCASYYDLLLQLAAPPAAGSQSAAVMEKAGVAWTYKSPSNPAFLPLANYISFYPVSPLRCFVDDEEVQAQQGNFYGGWITSEITGGAKGFKGGPGTLGW